METPTEYTENKVRGKRPSAVWKWLGRLFRLCIAIVVIGGSATISYLWVTNPPVTQRRPRGPEAVLVEVMPIEVSRQQITVRAMGTVLPATQIQLAARVNGQIVETDSNFIPGGRFARGQKIMQIDPKDYELVIKQQTGNLVKAQSEVRQEMGQQSVAQREYELLLDTVVEEDTDLVLRQPQLATKEAAVEIAQATLDKAQLDLERTSITAPFNAVVHERKVELGSYVTPGSSLATLVGTDEFWIEVSIPVDELKWIDFPDSENDTGSPVRVFNPAAWGEGVYRSGHVKQLLPALESKGRMARVLVTVAKPLDQEEGAEPSLLLDSFVRVEIEGLYLDDVVQVARTVLQSGDNLWIMLPDNTLDIRPVTVIWGTSDVVFVQEGLKTGDRLVVSDLATPIPGLKLRTADMPRENGSGQGGKPDGNVKEKN